MSKALKAAVKCKVILVMPVHTEQLEAEAPVMEFYEFADYAGLVEAAEKVDRRPLLVVLLGGDAGLRTGEIIALERSDIDFKRRFITVAPPPGAAPRRRCLHLEHAPRQGAR